MTFANERLQRAFAACTNRNACADCKGAGVLPEHTRKAPRPCLACAQLSDAATRASANQPTAVTTPAAVGLPVQHYEARACDRCAGTGHDCNACDQLGRTITLRSPQDGGEPLPATLSLLAERLRAIVTNDLGCNVPELPAYLLDRLTLLAYAAETINRKRTSDENQLKVALVMEQRLREQDALTIRELTEANRALKLEREQAEERHASELQALHSYVERDERALRAIVEAAHG